MSPFNFRYFLLFITFSTGYILTCTFAAPIDNPYQKFIEFLVENKCSMPSVIKLPFNVSSSNEAPFNYLTEPLKECQSPDALSDNDEAKPLCKEIFEIVQNITCNEYKTQLPEIQSEPLSKNVCKDFATRKIEKTDYLSSKFVDSAVCKFLCSEKYHRLCETLLWIHDLQIKINNLTSSDGNADLNKNDSGKKGSSPIKNVETPDEAELHNMQINDKKASNGVKADVQLTEDENAPKVLPNLKLDADKNSLDVQNTATKIDSPISNNQKKTTLNGVSETETTVGKIELKADYKDSQSGKLNENFQNENNAQGKNDLKADSTHEIKTTNVNAGNLNPETASQETINVDYQPSDIEDNKKLSVENQHPLVIKEEPKNNSPLDGNVAQTSQITPVDEDKTSKSKLENSVEDQRKNNVTKQSNVDVNTKSNENLDVHDTQDNELTNNNFLGEENESKVKQTNLKTDDRKKTETPKLTDFESPLGGQSELESKLTESTTMELLLDKEEDGHQQGKDQDLYNDTENEDYAKSEYGIENPSLKEKEGVIKNFDLDVPSNYDISGRKKIGFVPEEGVMISSIPEQEDGHFFFYFLSIVLILMAGYLIYHNKQKIIALIVEGRHERRRRSHGYKKLDTK